MSNLAKTAAAGVRLETLRALRDRLAQEIDASGSPRDVAALSKQLTDVLEQIEALTPPEEDDRDEFDALLDDEPS